MVRDNTRTLPRSRYSYRQHANTTQGRQGDFTLNKAVQHEVWSPSWNHTFTTFRPFPVPTAENPDVLTGYRQSSDDSDFDDWIRAYPAIRQWGEPGVTFILWDPADETYDPQQNPAWILFRALNQAIDAKQEGRGWAALTRGNQNRRAQVSRPTEISFMQGAILRHRSKVYLPPRGGSADDKLTILQLSTSASAAMVALLNRKKEGYTGNPEDYENAFEHGDPVSLEHGRYITWYQIGTQTAAAPVSATSAFGKRRDSGEQRGSATEEIGFECEISPTFQGMPARLDNIPGMADIIRNRVKPWDELIRIPTHAEQIRLLSGALPPDLICHAFQDFIDEVPENVRSAARGAVSVPVGAVPFDAGAEAARAGHGFGGSPVAAPATAAPVATSGWGAARPAEGASASRERLGNPVAGAPEHVVQDTSVPTAFPPAAAAPVAAAVVNPSEPATAAPVRRRRPASAAADAARAAMGDPD